MLDTLGLVLTGDNGNILAELTRNRSVSAVPVAGRYRVIDFIISNMVNSGISNVGVATRSHYRSLMDHLGSGKEWDLNRKLYGLRILPPYSNSDMQQSIQGDMDILGGVLDFLRRSTQKYVLLAGADLMFNTTFEELERCHIENHADITVLCHMEQAHGEAAKGSVALKTGESGRVLDMEVGAAGNFSGKRSMGIYLMEKQFLEYQINRCMARGLHDFVMDVLVHNLNSCRIYACCYEGYVGRIDSVASYYACNMQLLDPKICDALFNVKTPIYTKVKDQVPCIHGEHGAVKNSLVADGCIIKGRVENCIVFRGVQIEEGASVSNCIIMQNSRICRNAQLDYVILDKSVEIRQGKRLMGQESYPVVIAKNIIV